MKFKPGDKVRISKRLLEYISDCTPNDLFIAPEMEKYIDGKTIYTLSFKNNNYFACEEIRDWIWDEDFLEPVGVENWKEKMEGLQ